MLEFTNVSGNVESITVAELLSWIEHFAGVEHAYNSSKTPAKMGSNPFATHSIASTLCCCKLPPSN